MPPKSKKKAVDIEEGIDNTLKGLTQEQLRERINFYTQRLDKSMKNRNYMQLERDMVNNFLDVTRKEVLRLRAEIHNKDAELEKLESDHRVEVKVYEQKVKHQEYQQRIEKTEIQQYGEDMIMGEIKDLRGEIANLTELRVSIMNQYRKECLGYEEMTRKTEHDFGSNLTHLEENFARNYRTMQAEYEDDLAQLDRDLDLRRRVALHELEERKNQHMNDLMVQHREAFSKLQRYYADLTRDNLRLIRALKEEIATMTAKQAATLEKTAKLKAQTADLTEPLEAELREVELLEAEVRSFDKDALVLTNLQGRCTQLAADLKTKERRVIELENQLNDTRAALDDTREGFEASLRASRAQANARNAALTKKVQVDKAALAELQVQIEEVAAKGGLDRSQADAVARSVEGALLENNQRVSALRFELARAIKAFNDAAAVYSYRLHRDLGISVLPAEKANEDCFHLKGTLLKDTSAKKKDEEASHGVTGTHNFNQTSKSSVAQKHNLTSTAAINLDSKDGGLDKELQAVFAPIQCPEGILTTSYAPAGLVTRAM